MTRLAEIQAQRDAAYAELVEAHANIDLLLAAAKRDEGLLARVQELEGALRWYAERRNHHDIRERDAFDNAGPGARARAALAGSPAEEQTRCTCGPYEYCSADDCHGAAGTRDEETTA